MWISRCPGAVMELQSEMTACECDDESAVFWVSSPFFNLSQRCWNTRPRVQLYYSNKLVTTRSYSWLWKLRVCKQNPAAGEIRRMRITTAVAVCLTDQKKALQWERLLICRNQMPISSGNRLCKWTCVYSTAGELINLGNPKKIKVIFLTTKILILNYIVTLLLIFFFAQITNILGLIIIVAHCSYCINCHLCHKFRRLHECNSNFQTPLYAVRFSAERSRCPKTFDPLDTPLRTNRAREEQSSHKSAGWELVQVVPDDFRQEMNVTRRFCARLPSLPSAPSPRTPLRPLLLLPRLTSFDSFSARIIWCRLAALCFGRESGEVRSDCVFSSRDARQSYAFIHSVPFVLDNRSVSNRLRKLHWHRTVSAKGLCVCVCVYSAFSLFVEI